VTTALGLVFVGISADLAAGGHTIVIGQGGQNPIAITLPPQPRSSSPSGCNSNSCPGYHPPPKLPVHAGGSHPDPLGNLMNGSGGFLLTLMGLVGGMATSQADCWAVGTGCGGGSGGLDQYLTGYTWVPFPPGCEFCVGTGINVPNYNFPWLPQYNGGPDAYRTGDTWVPFPPGCEFCVGTGYYAPNYNFPPGYTWVPTTVPPPPGWVCDELGACWPPDFLRGLQPPEGPDGQLDPTRGLNSIPAIAPTVLQAVANLNLIHSMPSMPSGPTPTPSPLPPSTIPGPVGTYFTGPTLYTGNLTGGGNQSTISGLTGSATLPDPGQTQKLSGTVFNNSVQPGSPAAPGAAGTTGSSPLGPAPVSPTICIGTSCVGGSSSSVAALGATGTTGTASPPPPPTSTGGASTGSTSSTVNLGSGIFGQATVKPNGTVTVSNNYGTVTLTQAQLQQVASGDLSPVKALEGPTGTPVTSNGVTSNTGTGNTATGTAGSPVASPAIASNNTGTSNTGTGTTGTSTNKPAFLGGSSATQKLALALPGGVSSSGPGTSNSGSGSTTPNYSGASRPLNSSGTSSAPVSKLTITPQPSTGVTPTLKVAPTIKLATPTPTEHIDTNKITTPTVHTPTVHTPTIHVATPTIHTPRVHITTPTVRAPTVHAPTIRIPTIRVPTIHIH
jgi:hypothetical protein